MIDYITSGESHGRGMLVTVRGIPAGLQMDLNFINEQLKRRQVGYGRGGRMKIEQDEADILSGVRNGYTTGSPVTVAVWNKDWENWKGKQPEPVLKPRPGHADLIGAYKYGLTDDIRGVLERSSARETAARVAGCAIARLFIRDFGIRVFSHVVNWGGIEIDVSGMSFDAIREAAEVSDLRCAGTPEIEEKIREKIDRCQKDGDTMGGTIEIVVNPMLPGLGSYQTWERKLDSRIAASVLSVQGIKGLEFGLGFAYAQTTGKSAHDEIEYDIDELKYCRPTNRAGGIEGGMSNGNPLIFRAVMKPIPTLMSPLNTVNIATKEPEQAVKERSDVTAVGAAGVVLENVIAVDIANAVLERYGGDSMNFIKKSFVDDPLLRDFHWRGTKKNA